MKRGFTGLLALQMTVLVSVLGATGAQATEFFVTSVIREFPMKAGEAQYKDYYINAGSNNGLHKGLIIEAVRRMPAYDNINSKLIGDTPVKIARLKLIHVDKGVSVARLVKFYEKENTPLAGFDSVMIGDFIEVAEKQ